MRLQQSTKRYSKSLILLRLFFVKRDEIKRCIQLFPKILSEVNRNNARLLQKTINDIQELLRLQYRRYLKVFHLAANTRLTDTVFQAVFESINDEERLTSKFRKYQIQLLNFMKTLDASDLLKLAVYWNCLDEAHEIFELQTTVNSIYVYLITENIDHLLFDLFFKSR